MPSDEVVPNIPASVLDGRALRLVRIARESLDLAIETAPNWKGSKLTVEDIQRLDSIRRELEVMTFEASA